MLINLAIDYSLKAKAFSISRLFISKACELSNISMKKIIETAIILHSKAYLLKDDRTLDFLIEVIQRYYSLIDLFSNIESEIDVDQIWQNVINNI